MTNARCAASWLAACCWLAGGWLQTIEAADPSPTIREVHDASGTVIAIEAGPLPASDLEQLSRQSDADADAALAGVLRVLVDDAAVGQTAMVGSYRADNQTLRFTPRFPLRAGQAYRAVLRWLPSTASAGIAAGELTYRFRAPAGGALPPGEVAAVFPSAAVLPENQLRFYIHFSTPMSRGSAYDHIRLLDSSNRALELPFLEIGEELWDPQQQRLTLLIDPGRIKRGVLPREELGTVLRAGQQFTLVVKASWLDAQNRPLRADFAKTFRVGRAIEQAVDPAGWQLRVPAAGTREPLALEFPRPLDRALLERMIAVRSNAGKPVAGGVHILREERRWELQPTEAWRPGKYEISIDRALEDLAGNRIGRPFEVDQAEPISRQITSDADCLGFEIAPPRLVR